MLECWLRSCPADANAVMWLFLGWLMVVGIYYCGQNENVAVKVGFMDGKKIDFSTISDLAALESIEKVRTKFVCLLKASPSKFVRILDAYQKK